MTFSLTPEQRELAFSIRTLLADELVPIVEEFERRERFPVKLVPRLAALDVLGLSFSPPLGSGGGHVEIVVLTEELAAVAGGVCSGVMTHCIGAKMIDVFGTREQKERYLVPALKGDLICAIAITEPDHGSDVASIQTRATRARTGWPSPDLTDIREVGRDPREDVQHGKQTATPETNLHAGVQG